MSYTTEHKRMKPVLDLARKLDIATNPAPEALFEAGSGGFQIWATPDDHPKGWDGVPMDMGAFAKPCAFVASVWWGWEGETIYPSLPGDGRLRSARCEAAPAKDPQPPGGYCLGEAENPRPVSAGWRPLPANQSGEG